MIRKLTFIPALAVPCIILWLRPTAADDAALQKRVEELEIRVHDLEKLLQQLQRNIAPNTAEPTTSTGTNWRTLQRGMSKGTVKQLLGEPKWIQSELWSEYWMYKERSIIGRGVVQFMRDTVSGWNEP